MKFVTFFVFERSSDTVKEKYRQHTFQYWVVVTLVIPMLVITMVIAYVPFSVYLIGKRILLFLKYYELYIWDVCQQCGISGISFLLEPIKYDILPVKFEQNYYSLGRIIMFKSYLRFLNWLNISQYYFQSVKTRYYIYRLINT